MDEIVEAQRKHRGLNRRAFVLGGAFLGTAGLAAALEPRGRIDLLGKGKLEDVIPERVGPWSFASKSGLVVPPSDQLSDQLYSQLLTRVYTAPGMPAIMLLVAQSGSQTGVLQVHRPEVCYPAGGYRLSNSMPVELQLAKGSVQTMGFTASAESRIEQLIYWTRVGMDLPSTWAEQRWSVAKANLQGDLPDAVLVRLSTLSPDREASFGVLEQFATTLVTSLPTKARAFVVGPGRA